LEDLVDLVQVFKNIPGCLIEHVYLVGVPEGGLIGAGGGGLSDVFDGAALLRIPSAILLNRSMLGRRVGGFDHFLPSPINIPESVMSGGVYLPAGNRIGAVRNTNA
jgi:hypothetical protein